MKNIFNFGEHLPEYNIPVLNEREVRASAGILFTFALIAFMNAWLVGNFQPIQLFVTIFLVDFAIRLFINPKYAPTLILGRIMVRNQKVEYTGAPQKRFAWGIGFVLALIMFYLVVLNSVIGPINLLVCILCLTLLFFESAFGICIGCKVYNVFNKEKTELCPGGVCETRKTEAIQHVAIVHWIILLIAFAGVLFAHQLFTANEQNQTDISVPEGEAEEECYVPDWAKEIGHEEQYVLHNGCNSE